MSGQREKGRAGGDRRRTCVHLCVGEKHEHEAGTRGRERERERVSCHREASALLSGKVEANRPRAAKHTPGISTKTRQRSPVRLLEKAVCDSGTSQAPQVEGKGRACVMCRETAGWPSVERGRDAPCANRARVEAGGERGGGGGEREGERNKGRTKEKSGDGQWRWLSSSFPSLALVFALPRGAALPLAAVDSDLCSAALSTAPLDKRGKKRERGREESKDRSV